MFSGLSEICKLAGSNTKQWKTELLDDAFSAILETNGLWFRGLSDSGRRICRLLIDWHNWDLPLKDLGKLAKITDMDRVFKRQMLSVVFVNALDFIGFPHWMSRIQRRLVVVLKDSENHALNWRSLAHECGFSTRVRGLRALLLEQPNHAKYVDYLASELDFHFWMSNELRQVYVRIRDQDGRPVWLEGGSRSIMSYAIRRTVDERFDDLCEKLGVYLWMDEKQRRIFSLFDSRRRTFLGLSDFSLAVGLHESSVIKAFKIERFAALLRDRFDFHSWMTWSQIRIYEVVRGQDSASDIADLLRTHNIPIGAWYAAVKDTRFRTLIEDHKIPVSLGRDIDGVPLTSLRGRGPAHTEVEYLESPDARIEYLKLDKWDLRRLVPNYRRGYPPHCYIVDFTLVTNASIREEIKDAFKEILRTREPSTVVNNARCVARFVNTLCKLYPHISSLSDVRREYTHAVAIHLGLSKRTATIVSVMSRTSARHLDKDGDYDPTVYAIDDLPRSGSFKPRPMDVRSMEIVDSYLFEIAIPSLINGIAPKPLSVEQWNAFILLRYAGLRGVSLRHLIAIGPERALRKDPAGDLMLYVPGRFTKNGNPYSFPIAHLNGLASDKNPIESAINRQTEIAIRRGPSPDGTTYLFTHSIRQKEGSSSVEPVSPDYLTTITDEITRHLDLGSSDGPAKLLPIILRHTYVTELAEAGVQLETIAEIVGHASLKSTEHYYGLGLSWRMPLPPLVANEHVVSAFSNTVDVQHGSTTPAEYLVHIELSDAVCESVITGGTCIAMRCLACPYKDLTPADIPRVRLVIQQFDDLVQRARAFNLVEKVAEFTLILEFNKTALSVLLEGRNFRGERDLPHNQTEKSK